MGFFFLLAGYFTPASYERKGPWQFSIDRLIRLGVPLAVFAILLDPLTNAIALAWGRPPEKTQPFLPDLLHRIFTADWNNGPLWFAQALLIFSAAYVGWRTWHGKEALTPDAALPSFYAWFVSAVGVGAAALLIRQWIPVGRNVFGLQLGYFSSYIFLFAVGTFAWQRNWLNRVTWKIARPWTLLSVALLPAIIIGVIAGGKQANFSGGFSLPAIIYAFWEPFIAWGVIAAYLVWFRNYGNRPSAVWEYLAARAYAVYILHPPVLVAVAIVFRAWPAPALAKFAVVGPLAWLTTVGVSSLVLRIPGARRVV